MLVVHCDSSCKTRLIHIIFQANFYGKAKKIQKEVGSYIWTEDGRWVADESVLACCGWTWQNTGLVFLIETAFSVASYFVK